MAIDHNNVISRINKNDNLLEILIDIEDFLDSIDLRTFSNWYSGEIVEGPHIKRYFIDFTLKYPWHQLPDPEGAQRLRNFQILVKYRKATELKPVAVTKKSDMEDGTNRPKMVHTKVLLVHLRIPRRYIDIIDEINNDYEDDVDSEHLDQAADEGISDENILTGGSQPADPNAPPPPPGGAGPAPTPPPAPPAISPMGG